MEVLGKNDDFISIFCSIFLTSQKFSLTYVVCLESLICPLLWNEVFLGLNSCLKAWISADCTGREDNFTKLIQSMQKYEILPVVECKYIFEALTLVLSFYTTWYYYSTTFRRKILYVFLLALHLSDSLSYHLFIIWKSEIDSQFQFHKCVDFPFKNLNYVLGGAKQATWRYHSREVYKPNNQ